MTKISQFEFLVMTEKNIFLSLNVSGFKLFFMWKLQPPHPWKKSPPLSQQPPSKSLRPVKAPLFENLVGGWALPPSAEKGRVHTMLSGKNVSIFLPLIPAIYRIVNAPKFCFQEVRNKMSLTLWTTMRWKLIWTTQS